jgi:pimeloyl-ACP methyl ester carboxylesterase
MAPRPYTIEVPDAVLDDLRERLGRTRWPEQIPTTGWDYGVDVAYLRELCEHWRDGYDWRRWEARLNELPGFRCEVDGVDLHYWHVRGVGPAPMPLMLIHGWPGSMMEFLELIGPLADPGAYGGDPADAFDVVVPALPGFGFGGVPRERGWGVPRIAAALHALMTRELGYERYAAQGGDWGSMISAKLGATYPEQVAGIHLNFILAPPPSDPGSEDAEALERLGHWRATQSAYLQIQSTLPDSVTVAQADSPAGLAAWIVEKFRRWSDCGGDVERAFSKDTLLTNLMFYWAPNSTPAAARIYYESAQDPDGTLARPRVEVPVAYAAFPREIVRPPRHWVEPHYAIARWTEMPRGGHFAALEQPDLLLDDVRVFLRTLR